MASYSPRQTSTATTTGSSTTNSTTDTASGESNAAMQGQIPAQSGSSTPTLDLSNETARVNDRALAFEQGALNTISPKDLGYHLGTKVSNAMEDFEGRNKKDGVNLTVEEKVWVSADFMFSQGLSTDQVTENIKQLFYGSKSRGVDKVWLVTMEGSQLRVCFIPGSVDRPGPIEDLLIGAPSVYDGEDTNQRQAKVDSAAQGFLSNEGHRIPVKGTFLDQPKVIEKLYLTRFPEAAALKSSDLAAFQNGLTDYMYDDLVWDYMIKAEYAVLDALGDVAGRDPAAVAAQALGLAKAFENPYVAARKHGTTEIQDEAVVQNVMKKLGFDVNIDTDTGTASSVKKA